MEGCDNAAAVAKINAFVLEAKRHAQQQAQQKTWLERAAVVVTVVALGLGFLYHTKFNTGNNKGFSLGGGGGSGGVDNARRLEIEEQRRRAAKREEDAHKAALVAKEAPSWRENEEKEVWSSKQEKQFAKALISFGGVPPKGRYHLIADKVDFKSRQECLMHHKLQQLIAKEQ